MKKDWRDRVTWYTHETALLKLVRLTVRSILPVLATTECVGFENIPRHGPCILASNHINNLDVLFYGSYLPRHTYSMGKKELFDIPLFGWALRMLGSFPVHRGEQDQWALEQASRILDAGEMLFLFPEGTRGGREAKLRKGKTGSVKLALTHQAPLIPAAIIGTQDFRWGWRRNHIRMQVGQPLDVAALAGSPPYEYETIRELTTILMREIAGLLPPAHRGFYY